MPQRDKAFISHPNTSPKPHLGKSEIRRISWLEKQNYTDEFKKQIVLIRVDRPALRMILATTLSNPLTTALKLGTRPNADLILLNLLIPQSPCLFSSSTLFAPIKI